MTHEPASARGRCWPANGLAARARLRRGVAPRAPLPCSSLVSLLAFLPGFFQIPPVDRDEARFAQATKQMIETGDYVDIRFQDEVRYKKPVGIYWLQAAVVKTAQRARRAATRCTTHLALPHAVAARRHRRGAADLLGGARLRRRGARAVLAGADDGELDPPRRRSAARQDRRHAAAHRRRRDGRAGARLSAPRREPAADRAAGRCRRSSGPRLPAASCSRAR